MSSNPQIKSYPDIIVVPNEDLGNNAHAVFRHYREKVPFIKSAIGVPYILRANDVLNLVSDQYTRQVETEFLRIRNVTKGPLYEFVRNSMLFSNDTIHRHRRGPMTRTFAFKMIAEIRPQIRALADKILRDCYADGRMDFLQTYASSIPATTIAAILGIPESDIPRFTRSIYTIAKAISASWSAADLPEIDQAVADMKNYVEELLADRRRTPRNDFLSEYIVIVEQQGILSPFEAITQIITIVLGGSDTTRMAMAMQVCLLLEHPEQWRAIVEDQSLIPNAVLESLRFEPSVASIPRVTVKDIEIDGHFIPKNQPIALSTMSAMRDAAIYPAGDTFDIRRTHPKWHLVFGAGAHRCIGEALAKAELEEGLAALVEKMPSLRLAGPRPIASGFSGIRSVTDMTVEW